MSKSIKIDDPIHEWLFDHRDSKHKTISQVIKGLINDSVAVQLIGMKLEPGNKEVEQAQSRSEVTKGLKPRKHLTDGYVNKL